MADRRHILVVEDERLVADALIEALSERHAPSCVTTASEALECLRLNHFDLVLLDYGLPGGGADDVAVQADLVSVPVVLMSGDPDAGSQPSCRALPFLQKPFRLAELQAMVETAIP